MHRFKFFVKFIVAAFVVQKGHLISIGSTKDDNAEILWNLSQLAVQSNQVRTQEKAPSEFQLNPDKFSKYIGPIKPNSLKKSKQEEVNPKLMNYNYPQVPQRFPGYLPNIPNHSPGYPAQDQSFMGALHSIARNDRLQCVPRLLCELTSGPGSEKQQSSLLPFNINMESIVGLVSALSGAQSNPLLQFGKAALLGYSAKGNTRSCMYAYPECPQDPDKLVEYLNNYNGGFFRYFNGIQRPQQVSINPNPYQQQRPDLYQQQPNVYRPHNQRPDLYQYPQGGPDIYQLQQRPDLYQPHQPNLYQPQQRPDLYQLQQRPVYLPQLPNRPLYSSSNYAHLQQYYPQASYQYTQQYGLYNPALNRQKPYQPTYQFGNNGQFAQKRIQNNPNYDEPAYSRDVYRFKFPNSIDNFDYSQDKYENPIRFSHSINLYKNPSNYLLSNYENSLFKLKPSSMIFPDRTGTGELRLDPDEFYINGKLGKRPRDYRDRIVNFKSSNFKFPSVDSNL